MLKILFDNIMVLLDDIPLTVECSDQKVKDVVESAIKDIRSKHLFRSWDIYREMGRGGVVLKYLQQLYGERVSFVDYEKQDLGPDEPGRIY